MHVAWARSVGAQIKEEGVFQTGERQRGEEAAEASSRYVPLSARATGPGAPGSRWDTCVCRANPKSPAPEATGPGGGGMSGRGAGTPAETFFSRLF